MEHKIMRVWNDKKDSAKELYVVDIADDGCEAVTDVEAYLACRVYDTEIFQHCEEIK